MEEEDIIIIFVTGRKKFLYSNDIGNLLERNYTQHNDKFNNKIINDAKKFAIIKIIDYLKTTKVNSEEKYVLGVGIFIHWRKEKLFLTY